MIEDILDHLEAVECDFSKEKQPSYKRGVMRMAMLEYKKRRDAMDALLAESNL